MSHTPLTLLKSQLTLGHDLDDALLQHKLDVAEEWIGNHTGTPLADPVPVSLTEAALQLAAYWYVQREGASDMRLAAVPFGVLDLIAPYKESVTGNAQ
ncbi:head-tail connector protein [Thalassorhabdomicrobium marinisediminis]|uniref:Phage gp6-like head-tail connector protein n=1 Tax=Thalassorhabdomicrobium marinisediminis TaxID=2170577 RepID=A0A2T7FVC8_9RHOB|nr:head-tail connector protein [Thalassorhabdomicrobium marinisediminis]PVA06114.1 phage gp6-like head-tail connector protein [Thalassorhabdomicrobium marinisediminis]